MTQEFIRGMLASALYSALGIVMLVLAFVVIDKLTPGSLWQEIMEKQNRALATLAAGVAIGVSIIIAAAVAG